jgi:hypothetical protein
VKTEYKNLLHFGARGFLGLGLGGGAPAVVYWISKYWKKKWEDDYGKIDA